jgi:seryl-tRNA synthetase
MMATIRISAKIPPSLCRDIEQGVFYCSESILRSRVDRVARDGIELDLATDADQEAVRESVAAWIEQTLSSSLVDEERTLEAWRKWQLPPHTLEDLLASDELRPLGEGLLAYGPGLTRVLRGIALLFEQLSEEAEAEPYTLSGVVPLELLQRCDYLKQFPQVLSFVGHFREEFSVIDAYSSSCQDDRGEGCCQPEPDALKPYSRLLRPAVCYQLYSCFEGTSLTHNPTVVSSSGECFRYESRNTTQLDRLFAFRMHEIVALGTQDVIVDWRQSILKKVIALFEDTLCLPGRVSVENDPFFVSSATLKSTFQRAMDLKYELQIPFPNREGHIAVASFNIHQSFFGDKFRIQTSADETAWTSCAAFGLDRVLAVLLTHHGLDLANWPATVRDALNLPGPA